MPGAVAGRGQQREIAVVLLKNDGRAVCPPGGPDDGIDPWNPVVD
jgi:hypothetical protein